MGSHGSTSDVTREDVRGLFSRQDRPCTPISAAEAANKLERPQKSVTETLTELVELGELQFKHVDGTTRVWWRPGDETAIDQGDGCTAFAAFIDAVEDYAIFMLDSDGNVASWNEGAQRTKGYEEDEIVGEHVSTFYREADIDEGVPKENLETAAEQGRVEVEGWRVRKDGDQFWANVTITAIRDDDGTLQGFTKVTRDMTERREYEQRLQRERDLTEQILETVPVSLFVSTADGEITRANQRVLDRLDIEDADLEDYSLESWEIYDAEGEAIPIDKWPWTQVLDTGEPVYDYQCQVELPGLGRRWLSLDAAPLEDGTDEEEQIVFSVDDITEQKEREQQLRREHDQTQKLLRTAPIAIAVQDAEGETVMANQRAQNALGLSEQEFIEEPENADEWDLYDTNGNPISPDETPAARVLATGEPVVDEELIFDPPSGDRMQFTLNASPVFAPDGSIERVITAGEDITELKKREQQLKERKTELETELSEILGRISDAFYALDDEWRFTHLNDQAAEPMQQTKEEVLGQTVWDIIPDASEDRYREKYQLAMETQEPVSFELYEEDFDAWFEYNLYPSDTGLSIYFRDVTERMEHERELTKYETIVETVNDGIYVKDEHGRFTMVNEAYAELTGYDRSELIGEHASLVVDEATIERSREMLTTVDGTAENSALEAEIRREDGDSVPVEGTFATFQTDDGVPQEVGVVRDITERKMRERVLREREQRLQRYKEYTDDILNAIDDIFYLLDTNGDLQRWNGSIGGVTGYSNAEIESMNALEFFVETDRETIANAIAEGFETGDARVEAAILTKEGEHVPYEFVASTLEDPDGNVVLAGIGRDITDRREYERRLEESNERLEQFAYAASHDLQEPLRMITSYLQLLENRYTDDLDEDAEDFIEFAVGGAERMREMIEGLLQYSRVETRGDPFTSVDLGEVLSNVRDDLQVKIEESNAQITAEELPRVQGDRGQLRQVFQNLVDNAIEYSGDEPPQIQISVRRSVRNNGPWEISVEDEGIGIDPDDADRIFEVFQSLHSQGEHSGTGIGLALCQRIVERHGGEIWVDSKPNEGATFSFTLPTANKLDEQE
ncbi:PAS domain S-box protein [Halomontanus rarus]|uniref:PAS domain S-box protein n=1 Tax=Halomontanus rarus TaxID=3034020 RepID=UPI0023E8E6FB|nr:PAS domain S-box protein [Halovivax sp. TS33]